MRPIANKYLEGKMKSTLKRKLMVRETGRRHAHGISNALLRLRQFCLVTLLYGSEWTIYACLLIKTHISQECASAVATA